MPSTPYDLVQDDQDLRVPLHAEQAFFHGITFQAKLNLSLWKKASGYHPFMYNVTADFCEFMANRLRFPFLHIFFNILAKDSNINHTCPYNFVGWEEVPRPNTRAEIVQAMRRIRYECKVQNLKKRKVTINISVNGVRVVLKKRRRKKKNWTSDPEEIELLNHPVYRIFYVSHDSSDLKIFSYIARDASTDTFKCSVFKSHKKSQAMRIVRTVGQAFEVCHKFNLHKNSLDHHDERSDVSSELLDVEHIAERNELSDDEVAKKDQLAAATEPKPPQRPNHLELLPQSNLNMRKSPSLLTPDEDKSPTTPSSPSREVHKLKDQLEQQAMQTRQALAQLMLVREQLISETNARIEAQARTQQLLQQNRELLEHLASLGAYSEQQTTGLTSANIGMAPQSQLQMLLQATGNNNNLATINQQISNLGSINQQLTSLSHQLSGLNQQSQNLQNFQNINAGLQQTSQQLHQQQQQQQQQQALTPPTPAASLHQSQLHLNVATPTTANNSNSNSNAIGVSSASALSTSPYPSMNQLQSISSQLQQMNAQSAQHQQDALSKDLFQVNQELLNRLQALNLGAGNTNANALALNGSPLPSAQQTPSPHSSFFFVNPMSCSPSNNNNSASNFNFLSTASSLAGNLTPSPMGTLNRNSYTHSPQPHDDLGLSIDKNLNSLDEQLMKPLAGQLSAAASNGNIASTSGTRENSRSSSTVDSPSSPRGRNNNEPRFNTVMLKVTDEAGNVTNQRKLSATPSFIQRSTSEKVPNRSQMMSQVQRTTWARHTTK